MGQYRAWGELAKANDSEGNAANVEMPLRFQGQYFDAETGLHYNRFRYYDPQVGRFTTQDRISLAGGVNLYQYALNPIGWIDPLGLTNNPIYENPGHHNPGYMPNRQVPFNNTKSVIPSNAEELFKHSQVDPNDPKTRWVKVGEGKKANWHRFQSSSPDGTGPFHWNGSTDAVDVKGNPRAINPNTVPKFAKKAKGVTCG